MSEQPPKRRRIHRRYARQLLPTPEDWAFANAGRHADSARAALVRAELAAAAADAASPETSSSEWEDSQPAEGVRGREVLRSAARGRGLLRRALPREPDARADAGAPCRARPSTPTSPAVPLPGDVLPPLPSMDPYTGETSSEDDELQELVPTSPDPAKATELTGLDGGCYGGGAEDFSLHRPFTGAFQRHALQVGDDATGSAPGGLQRKIRNPLELFGLLVATGSNRMRGQDYERMRTVSGRVASITAARGAPPRWTDRNVALDSGNGTRSPPSMQGEVLPSLRTIQRHARDIMGHLTLKAVNIGLTIDRSKAGGRVTARQGGRAAAKKARAFSARIRAHSNERDCAKTAEVAPVRNKREREGSGGTDGPTAEAAVVLPSEYATLDVATAPVFEALLAGSQELDTVPIIIESREKAHGLEHLLAVDADKVPADERGGGRPGFISRRSSEAKIHPGDVVNIRVDNGASIRTAFRGLFTSEPAGKTGADREIDEDEVRSTGLLREGGGLLFRGCVSVIFHVDGARTWADARVQMRKRVMGLEAVNTATPSRPAAAFPMMRVRESMPVSVADRRLAALLSCCSHSHDPRPNATSRSKGPSRGRQKWCDSAQLLNACEPVRPGDIIAIIDALGDGAPGSARIALVTRWWALDGEPRRLLAVIPDVGDAAGKLEAACFRDDVEGEGFCLYGAHSHVPVPVFGTIGKSGDVTLYGPHVPVREVAVEERGGRGASERGGPALAPSVGYLSGPRGSATVTDRSREQPIPVTDRSREQYLIYRMALYHDGFQTGMTEGKSASAEGVYMLPLNLPREMRRSSSAVRVLSLTPPGSNVLDIVDVILDDIYKGATTGIAAIAADGRRIRVFLDLVTWIADTPAGNQLLDTKGHRALSPCHLCVFTIPKASEFRGRYASTAASGAMSAWARTSAAHVALRSTTGNGVTHTEGIEDAAAPKPACDLFSTVEVRGLKNLVARSSDRVAPRKLLQDMPLHAFSARLRCAAAAGEIATDSSGSPLLSGAFDPYRAVAVAPDHLLVGHFRDTVAVVLRMMTPGQRSASNAFLLSHQKAAGLDAQSDIVHVDKAALHSMTMSESYSLSIVAAPALLAGALAPKHAVQSDVDGATEAEDARKRGILDSNKTRLGAALSVVASAGELIAMFWTPQELVVEDWLARRRRRNSAEGMHARSVGSSPARSADRWARAAALEEHGRVFREKVRAHLCALDGLFTSRTGQVTDRPPRGPAGISNRSGGGAGYSVPARRRVRGRPRSPSSQFPSDSDESGHGGSRAAFDVRRLAEDAMKARTEADKPNVHRLLELADVFISDFQHGDFLGELPFETTHGPLKRSILRGNRQLSHLTAVTAAIMNDWEGRLAALHEGALARESTHLRGCARLLLGPEMLAATEAVASSSAAGSVSAPVPDHVGEEVLSALGKDQDFSFAKIELSRSQRRVLSVPRSPKASELAQCGRWAVAEPLQFPVITSDGGLESSPGAMEAAPEAALSVALGKFLRYRPGQSVFRGATWETSGGGSSSGNRHRSRTARAKDRWPLAFKSGDIVGLKASTGIRALTLAGSRLGRPKSRGPPVVTLGGKYEKLSLWCVLGVCADSSIRGSDESSPMKEEEEVQLAIEVILLPCEDVGITNSLHDAEGLPRRHGVIHGELRSTSREVESSVCKVHSHLLARRVIHTAEPHVLTLERDYDVQLMQDSLVPVAAVPDCASLLAPGSCAARPNGIGPWEVVHRAKCGPLSGGHFYARDSSTGFPPRRA